MASSLFSLLIGKQSTLHKMFLIIGISKALAFTGNPMGFLKT
jgi:hypothetical protein